MRLILSRKGFDSSAGGVASPIFKLEKSSQRGAGGSKVSTNKIFSLPIPVSISDGLRFNQIKGPWSDPRIEVATLVRDLTRSSRKPLGGRDFVHLDPDLRRDSLEKRCDGWLPSFGQSSAAAAHLLNQGVGVGDLFIFFGWFRHVQRLGNEWEFCSGKSNKSDLHLIFGWLQVGQVFRDQNKSKLPKWLQSHPHVCGHSAKARNNIIYVAKQKLDIDGLTDFDGGGVFETFSKTRVLTAEDAASRSIWNLPSWFAAEPRLSYHGNACRWKVGNLTCQLQTVGRGQEFVLDCENRPEAIPWIRNLFLGSRINNNFQNRGSHL